jgi:hypothetical protein
MKLARSPLGRRVLFVAAVSAALVALAAPAAFAQDDDGSGFGNDAVVLTGRLQVPEGATVGTAVMFNGPVVIEGTVTESLVVFNGRTEILGTVDGDVVVFNGTVVIRSGAHVGGDVITRSTPRVESGATIDGDLQNITAGLDVGHLKVIGRFAWWIAYTVSTLVLGMVLLAIAPGLDGAIDHAVRRRLGASFGFGALLFFLLPAAAVLLLFTVVGIPLGAFLLLAYGLVYSVGYVAGAHALGSLLIKPPTSRFLRFLAGWGILRLLALIPILGGVLWMIVALLGLGVLFVAARSSAREDEAPPMAFVPPAPA